MTLLTEEVRIAARAGLARVPDPAAAAAVLQSVDSTSGWERMQAAKCCLVAAESLAAVGQGEAAKGVYDRVTNLFTGLTEAHVRDAAAIGKTGVVG